MIPISDPDLHRRRWPLVNALLIGLNTLVFIYDFTLGADSLRFVYTFGLIPAELTAGTNFLYFCTVALPPFAPCPQQYQVDIATPWPAWTTLFTSMFMHGGLIHFGGNMLFLWVFGDNIEDTLGHILYLAFYLLAGLAASGLQIAIDTQSDVPVIGASGAIAGVLGAYFVLHPHSRIRTLIIYFFITVVRIPTVFLLGIWFVLQFFGGLGSLGPASQEGGVAYWAHVGGFAFGLAPFGLYRLITRKRHRPEPYGDWRL